MTLNFVCFVLFPIYFPEVLEVVLHDDVACTPDAVELLLSMFGLLSVSMKIFYTSIKKINQYIYMYQFKEMYMPKSFMFQIGNVCSHTFNKNIGIFP